MNAADFFRDVVEPNYNQLINNPNDLRALWNAVVSMNTIAEYVALDQLGFGQVPRSTLDSTAKQIREKIPKPDSPQILRGNVQARAEDQGRPKAAHIQDNCNGHRGLVRRSNDVEN